MSRGVEFNDGSLMVEPYELRRVEPDLHHEAALITPAWSTGGNEMPFGTPDQVSSADVRYRRSGVAFCVDEGASPASIRLDDRSVVVPSPSTERRIRAHFVDSGARTSGSDGSVDDSAGDAIMARHGKGCTARPRLTSRAVLMGGDVHAHACRRPVVEECRSPSRMRCLFRARSARTTTDRLFSENRATFERSCARSLVRSRA